MASVSKTYSIRRYRIRKGILKPIRLGYEHQDIVAFGMLLYYEMSEQDG